jgi:hypothetical protein
MGAWMALAWHNPAPFLGRKNGRSGRDARILMMEQTWIF